MVDVLDQGRGQNLHTYDLDDGKELSGKTLWLRAGEIDGPRILNYRFTVKSGEWFSRDPQGSGGRK